MSGQFNKSNFEQNPSKMKKKRSKEWVTNNDSSLCDADILSEEDIKAIKDANWKEKHVPKPSKKETKYRQEINRLESNSVKAPLSKAEEQKLKKLKKKHKKLFDYRHRDMESSHYGLRCCFVSILVVATIVFTAAFGAYHIFAYKYTGITLIEAGKMLVDLYNVDESAYNQNFDTVKDSQRFFDNLQNALYLDTKFDIDDILNLIPTNKGGTGGENASVADLLDKANDPTPSTNSSLTGNEYLDKLLADTKFDFSSLKDFNANKPTPVWEIEDKMVAAILQQVVDNLDKIMAENPPDLGGINIKLNNAFAVKQCLITKNANNETTFSVALKIKVSDIVTDILKDIDLREANFVKQIVPSLLPKSIYIHANITPEIDKAPTLGINSINQKSLQTLLNTLDSNLCQGKINETLNKVGRTIFSTISSIQEMTEQQGFVIAPSTGEEPGAIKFDVLSTALKKMNVKNVSSTDFLLMVKHLHTIDFDYPTEESYIEANGLTKTTIEEFNNAIVDLYASYGVDADYCKDITPTNFLDKIEDIPAHINIQNELKGDKIYNYTNEQLKGYSKLSDAALAQILNNNIKEMLGKDFDLKLIQLKMTDKTLELIAYIDIASIVSNQVGDTLGALQPFIMSMFPNNVYINIIVPYDKNGELKTDIIFNYTKDDNGNNNKDDSDKMFDTIANLIAGLNSNQDGESQGEASIWEKFNKEALINKLNNAIYPALESIVPSDSDNKDLSFGFTDGGLQLPTIYEILASTLNNGVTDDKDKMTASDIQNTMKGYYNYDGDVIDKNNNLVDNIKNASLSDFTTRELRDKLYFKNAIDKDDVYTTLQNFGSNLTAENIENIFDIKKLTSNNNEFASMNNFAITSLELAKIIEQSGTLVNINKIGLYKDFQLVDISVDASSNTLSLRMGATLDASAEGIAGIDLNNFAAKYLVVSAIINLGDYSTKIKINSADDTQIDNLLKLINKIIKSDGENASFDKTSVANDIGKAIRTAFENFEKNGLTLVASNKAVEESVNDRCDGFTSTNIYEIISEKINSENYTKGDGEKLKNVIYKLNNLPKKDGGEYCYTSITLDPLVWKDNNNDGKFDADGKFELDGSVKHLYEIEETVQSGQYSIKLYDLFFAQQIKHIVDTDNAKLIKFGIFVNSEKSIKDYENTVTDLGLVDYNGDSSKDIVPRNLAATANDYGVMFMHFEISNSMIGADALANKILPASIYGGSFITFGSNMADARQHSFINNLTKEETDYLNSLMVKTTEPPTEGGDGSEGGETDPDGGDEGDGENGGDGNTDTPITRAATLSILDTLDALVMAVLKVPFTVDIANDYYRYAPTELKLISLEQLLQNGFILKDANIEGFEMQKYCYGTYVKTVDVSELEELPEPQPDPDPDNNENGSESEEGTIPSAR